MRKTHLIFILCFSLWDIASAQLQTDTLSLFFDINESLVDENNAKKLDEFITNQNVIYINIYGYTDFLGNAEYNQQLSEKRSENIRNHLISKGIDKTKIILSKGKGIYPNSAEENRQNLSDKGIKDHRTVKIIYTKPQYISTKEALSEKNLVVGNNIVLGNILFFGASSELRPESYPVLEELFETMQKYPTLKIEVQGHICCYTGYHDSSDILTEKPLSISRAEVVRNNLIEKGIDPARMTCRGYAASRKRYPERNKYAADLNKRVEILILEK